MKKEIPISMLHRNIRRWNRLEPHHQWHRPIGDIGEVSDLALPLQSRVRVFFNPEDVGVKGGRHEVTVGYTGITDFTDFTYWPILWRR